jgi:hypothetical protein
VKSARKLFQADRKSIGFIKFILEGYDNVAFISTIDPFAGILSMNIAFGCEREAQRILDELRLHHLIRPVDESLTPLHPDNNP